MVENKEIHYLLLITYTSYTLTRISKQRIGVDTNTIRIKGLNTGGFTVMKTCKTKIDENWILERKFILDLSQVLEKEENF